MKRVVVALLLVWGVAAGALRAAEPVQPKLQDLVRDLQQLNLEREKMMLVFWLPTEYFEVSLAEQTDITEEQKREVCDAIRQYFILCIADGELNRFGSLSFRSREEVINDLEVKMNDGALLTPLADDEVSGEAQQLMAAIKPALASAAGQIGKGMNLYFFKGTDAQGQPIANARQAGGFVVDIGKLSFRWRLPLGSLLPPRFDGKTGEKFPGNYEFSPFTGEKLTTDPPADKG